MASVPNRRSDYVEARKYFEQALNLDAECGPALAGLSEVLSYEAMFGFADNPQQQLERAVLCGKNAVEIDEADAVSHVALARAYMVFGKHEQAIREFEFAINLNPYFANAYYSLGGTYIIIGRLEEGIAAVEKAMALSPQDIWMGNFFSRLAQAYISMADYEKAKENAATALRHQRSQWPGHSYLVSALGHLGRRNEAKAALKELLDVKPDLTIGQIRSRGSGGVMGLEFMDDYLDGLRKAGLPE